jgi:hypothetical protein
MKVLSSSLLKNYLRIQHIGLQVWDVTFYFFLNKNCHHESALGSTRTAICFEQGHSYGSKIGQKAVV